MEFLTLFPSPQARLWGDPLPGDLPIPPELKDRASNAGSRALLLARAGDVLWISYQSSFEKIDLTRCRQVRMNYRTPARGPGFISLTVANKAGKDSSMIVDYDQYTEELGVEAKGFAEKIGDFLGYKIKCICGGTDC